MKIIFSNHASERLVQRSSKLGLNIFESEKRTKQTIKEKKLSKSKQSKNNKIYYKYFKDNSAFFVIVFENKKLKTILVKTIIIKKGRE